MNKTPLIAAVMAAIAFSALPALASAASGLPTGTVVAQNADNANQSDSAAPSQSGDQDKDQDK